MKTNNTSPTDSAQNSEQNRHLRAECEARMMEALQQNPAERVQEGASENLSSERLATERLAELFVLFPDLRQEYQEMLSVLGTMGTYTAPPRSQDEWSSLEQQIFSRVGLRLSPSSDALSADNAPKKQARMFMLHPVSQVLVRLTAIAAIFVGGLFAGRWSLKKEIDTQDALTLVGRNAVEQHISSQGNISQGDIPQSEAEHFLHDAHLLMLGVMAMNAECGISHPQTLVAQRERCVALMAQAQELRRTISPQERQRLAHVIVQVEYALAELAGTQPASVNASMIRQLQAHTDDALCEVATVLASSRSQ
jgi:hypothetical protein